MGISISFRLLVDGLQFTVYSLQFTVYSLQLTVDSCGANTTKRKRVTSNRKQ